MKSLRENLRLIGAIASKDIVEAIKNRTLLAVLLSSVFVVLMYRFLPFIEESGRAPNLLVYDQGDSSLVAALENSPAFSLYTYASEERFMDVMADGMSPELGLIIPADFDARILGDDRLELQGYVLYWVTPQDALELVQLAEAELERLVGKPVRLNIDGNTVYMPPEAEGVAIMASMGVIFVALMTGILMPTHLMLEEKRTRTMDALTVSPAGPWHIVLGKAIAGLFYCLVGFLLVFALNSVYILQWGVLIAAALAASIFSIALGLLLGTAFETREQLMLWSWLMFVPLLLPPMMSIMEDLLPGWLIQVFQWIPTVGLFNAVRVSFSNQAPWATYLPQLLYVGAWTLGIMAVNVWVIRRAERG